MVERLTVVVNLLSEGRWFESGSSDLLNKPTANEVYNSMNLNKVCGEGINEKNPYGLLTSALVAQLAAR